MIFTTSEGLLKIISEVSPEIMKGHLEEFLIEILLKSETFGEDFFASNIWFARLRICDLSINHKHISNKFVKLSNSFEMFFSNSSGYGSYGSYNSSGNGISGNSYDNNTSSAFSLSKIYNFN